MRVTSQPTGRGGAETRRKAKSSIVSASSRLRGCVVNCVTSVSVTDLDDERRRYYRLTPFGREVANAEARRLATLVKLARSRGITGGLAGTAARARS